MNTLLTSVASLAYFRYLLALYSLSRKTKNDVNLLTGCHIHLRGKKISWEFKSTNIKKNKIYLQILITFIYIHQLNTLNASKVFIFIPTLFSFNFYLESQYSQATSHCPAHTCFDVYEAPLHFPDLLVTAFPAPQYAQIKLRACFHHTCWYLTRLCHAKSCQIHGFMVHGTSTYMPY